MDLLLHLLERRVIFGILALSFGIFYFDKYGGALSDRVDRYVHPPVVNKPSPLALDIIKDNQARQSAKLRGLHRTISAEIAVARSNGFDVERLQRIADSALQLDEPEFRPAAMERLNRLRLAIPTKKENFKPASAEDLNPDNQETERPKSRSKAVKKGRVRR